jgi:hypothetical protein
MSYVFLEQQNLMGYFKRSRAKQRVPGTLSETFTSKEYVTDGVLLNFLNESNLNITCTFNSDGMGRFNLGSTFGSTFAFLFLQTLVELWQNSFMVRGT